MNWRRNVASLSKIEQQQFTAAVKALKNKQANGQAGNKYDEFVLWHYAACL